jgi:Transposase DDE domain
MSRHPELYQWNDTLTSRFPKLPKTFVFLLTLWTLGMILARRCGLSSVCLFLSRLLKRPENTLRQRLREFYKEKTAKTGARQGRKRRDFDVTTCFAPLLAWILSHWNCRRLVLALDPTNLADRLHVLCISVVYRGMAIPVAWKVLRGGQQEAWHPHWCHLLACLKQALGDGWEVVVLTDRGLESPRLFAAIRAQDWHPLMRVKASGKFRPTGWHQFYAMGSFAPRVGSRFAVRGRAYKTSDSPLDCTFLACWEAGHDEPWLLLTDLAMCAANPCWYAYRAWIEQGFKVIKSGGWQWQQTKMTDPGRVERHWLAIAVATLWLVAVAGEGGEDLAVETVAQLPRTSTWRHGPVTGSVQGKARVPRLHRVFVQGMALLLAALLNREGLPPWLLTPEPWPEPWHDVPIVTEQSFCSGQFYP